MTTTFRSTDRVRVPAGTFLPEGIWAVNGEPKRWPVDNVHTFPASWRTDVQLLRGGGRDSRGNPQPVQELDVPGVLLAARATADPTDRSDLTTAEGVMYAPGGWEIALVKE